jgi:adenylylsulfate kinase
VNRGFTIWLTGRPRAGKSTLGLLLCRALNDLGLAAQFLDGSELRRQLSPELGFTPPERRQHALRAAYVAGMLNRHGVICVVGLVSPQAEDRLEARRRLGEFVEVHLDCPLEQAINRDAGGLYARALAGELPLFTGLDDPYEDPAAPFLRLPTSRQTPQESLACTLTALEQAGHLPPGSAAMLAPAGDSDATPEELAAEAHLRDLGYID